jgi:pilus assembly protein Flp/PilA
MSKFVAFLNDETGATAAEYGLILALIAGVIIASVTLVGGQVQAAFANVGASLTTAATTAA